MEVPGAVMPHDTPLIGGDHTMTLVRTPHGDISHGSIVSISAPLLEMSQGWPICRPEGQPFELLIIYNSAYQQGPIY